MGCCVAGWAGVSTLEDASEEYALTWNTFSSVDEKDRTRPSIADDQCLVNMAWQRVNGMEIVSSGQHINTWNTIYGLVYVELFDKDFTAIGYWKSPCYSSVETGVRTLRQAIRIHTVSIFSVRVTILCEPFVFRLPEMDSVNTVSIDSLVTCHLGKGRGTHIPQVYQIGDHHAPVRVEQNTLFLEEDTAAEKEHVYQVLQTLFATLDTKYARDTVLQFGDETKMAQRLVAIACYEETSKFFGTSRQKTILEYLDKVTDYESVELEYLKHVMEVKNRLHATTMLEHWSIDMLAYTSKLQPMRMSQSVKEKVFGEYDTTTFIHRIVAVYAQLCLSNTCHEPLLDFLDIPSHTLPLYETCILSRTLVKYLWR